MKLSFVALGVVVFGAMTSIGCGPGLSHHGQWAKAPTVTTEVPSTTTLTSAPLPADLPADRMPLAQWDEPAPPAAKTWGAPPEADPNYNPEYGF